MPMIRSDGCELYVEVEGSDSAPVLMLCNSLGSTMAMWDDQMPAWSKHFRIVRYDRRGHGRSSAPKGPYSYDMLGRDALAVMDAVGAKKVNFCGVSMGGMTGQWLGANAPDRLVKLVLSNTANYYADKSPWADRIKTVSENGIGVIVDPTMERWFTKAFRERAPDTIERMKAMLRTTTVDGYVGSCAAVRDMDFRQSNTRIKVPTLVIVGAHDLATPPAAGEAIQQQIPGARLASIEAAHIANVEQPLVYADTVLKFLQA